MRGDAFPVAGDSWTQLSITVLNHGYLAREMAYTWLIGAAFVSDKDSHLLKKLWAPNFKVRSILSLIYAYLFLLLFTALYIAFVPITYALKFICNQTKPD